MPRLTKVVFALFLLSIIPVAHAKDMSLGCGWYSQYLAGLGILYDEPVIQCSGSVVLQERTRIHAFVSVPTDGSWWENLGSEVDIFASYSFPLEQANVTLSSGLRAGPGYESLFFKTRLARNVELSEVAKLTPFLQGQVSYSVRGDSFKAYIEPGFNLGLRLYDDLSLDASSRLRFVTDDSYGHISSVGLRYSLSENSTLRFGASFNEDFRKGTSNHAFSISVRTHW